MINRSIIIFTSFLVLSACSGNTEDFNAAAKDVCSCMTNAQVDAEDASTASLNVGFCLLDAKVDLKSPEMKAEIDKQCPEFRGSYDEFVQDL